MNEIQTVASRVAQAEIDAITIKVSTPGQQRLAERFAAANGHAAVVFDKPFAEPPATPYPQTYANPRELEAFTGRMKWVAGALLVGACLCLAMGCYALLRSHS